MAPLGTPSTSAIDLADERDEDSTLSRLADSWFTLSSRTITPTIWPATSQTFFNLQTEQKNFQEDYQIKETFHLYEMTPTDGIALIVWQAIHPSLSLPYLVHTPVLKPVISRENIK